MILSSISKGKSEAETCRVFTVLFSDVGQFCFPFWDSDVGKIGKWPTPHLAGMALVMSSLYCQFFLDQMLGKEGRWGAIYPMNHPSTLGVHVILRHPGASCVSWPALWNMWTLGGYLRPKIFAFCHVFGNVFEAPAAPSAGMIRPLAIQPTATQYHIVKWGQMNQQTKLGTTLKIQLNLKIGTHWRQQLVSRRRRCLYTYVLPFPENGVSRPHEETMLG